MVLPAAAMPLQLLLLQQPLQLLLMGHCPACRTVDNSQERVTVLAYNFFSNIF